ncbi:unnamed protein product [Rotaria magnacalcarata]|uniref:Uncharacterized protein n=2 Tax=Rotaria magnacalcarata TaxID=392030 RepID=A0A816SH22_9BILA|nr:unnamed protein product [Rotaria magnacalcarata]CAF1667739.1 unnamed protein product [Rotaria magnacalcarata]CAF2074340.1 unnamed protein product [Rotaria magnacalcarata]CAF2086485.1 unnamed protein product [Rotaria magnacalcarata]CAF5181235.1 unnamed protein product [Rotaria magnacalcarata]
MSAQKFHSEFVLVLNAKKDELSKLKHQIELYQDERSSCSRENVVDPYNNMLSSSTSPRHATTGNYKEYSINKRPRHDISDIDTSEDEDIRDVEMSTRSLVQPKFKITDNNRDGSLDLGDDQMDYKASTISKHHQRRNYVTGINSISTRPFVNVSATMAMPSLPDDSQTADDLLNKI